MTINPWIWGYGIPPLFTLKQHFWLFIPPKKYWKRIKPLRNSRKSHSCRWNPSQKNPEKTCVAVTCYIPVANLTNRNRCFVDLPYIFLLKAQKITIFQDQKIQKLPIQSSHPDPSIGLAPNWSNYEVDLVQHQWGRRLSSRRLAVAGSEEKRTHWEDLSLRKAVMQRISMGSVRRLPMGFQKIMYKFVLILGQRQLWCQNWRRTQFWAVQTKLEPSFIAWNPFRILYIRNGKIKGAPSCPKTHLAAVLCSSSHLVDGFSTSQRESSSTIKTGKSSNIIQSPNYIIIIIIKIHQNSLNINKSFNIIKKNECATNDLTRIQMKKSSR